MFIKYHFNHKLFLLSTLTFVLLSGYGLTAVAKGTPTSIPDSVQIKLDTPAPGNDKVITLTEPKLTLRLYQLVYNLPQMPANLACTMELGPHYTLTFRQKNKVVGIALARREGCRPVTISGEQHDRQATTAFWTLVDQAIHNASTS